MAQRQGKCVNFGLCTMADSREAITLPEGEDFSCPECGKMLTELEGKGGGGSKGPGKSKLALAGLAVVLLAVGGYFLLTSDEDTKKKTDTVEDQKKKQDDSQKKAQEDAQKKAQEDAQRLQQEQQIKEQQAKEQRAKEQQLKEQQQRERQQREQQAQLEKEQLKQEKLKVRRDKESTKTADVADVTVEEPKYTGPSSGTIVWEGAVHGTEFVTIDNGSANKGALVSGKLPGIPVLIQPQNPKKVGIAGAPGPENKYQRVTLRVQGNGEMKVVLNWSLP